MQVPINGMLIYYKYDRHIIYILHIYYSQIKLQHASWEVNIYKALERGYHIVCLIYSTRWTNYSIIWSWKESSSKVETDPFLVGDINLRGFWMFPASFPAVLKVKSPP